MEKPPCRVVCTVLRCRWFIDYRTFAEKHLTDAQPHRAALPHRPLHPPATSPPSASWPALPTRTSLGPETNIPAWGRNPLTKVPGYR